MNLICRKIPLLAAGLCGISLLFTAATAAAMPSAMATGATEAQARENARAELAKFMKVEVRAEVGQFVDNSGRREDWTRNVSSTQLVLLGVLFDCHKLSKQLFACDAKFDEVAARKLYTLAVEDGSRRIADDAKALEQAPASEATRRVDALLTELEQLQGLLLVYRFILNAQPPALAVTREDLLGRLARLEDALPDLRTAAAHIAAQLDTNTVYYVAPPKLVGSEEITPFARAFADNVAAGIKSAPSLEGATRTLMGQYQITDSRLLVTWRVVMADGQVERTITQRLARDSAGDLRVTALQQGLDELLQNGLVLKGDLRAEVATSAGAMDGQVFTAGARIRLLVKLNKPGYFYIVGHVTPQQGEPYSYLVALNDADAAARPGSPEAKRAFVRAVNGTDANRFVEIGEFEVTPPFGVERLQVFASTTDLLDQLPPFAIRAEDDNRLDGNAQAVIGKTRALMRVKPKAESVESTFTYTTLPLQGLQTRGIRG